MNLKHLLQNLEKVNKEEGQSLSPRREAIRQFFKFGTRVTLASLPLAMGSITRKAQAQTSMRNTEEAFQFFLQLEYLAVDFYTLGLAAPGLIPVSAARSQIEVILDHDKMHVAYLLEALQTLEVTPVAKPTFDFTGGKGLTVGPFADVFSNYGSFLAVAQALKDTAVRAYKGQIAELTGAAASVTAALSIHSVEARHASHIRQIRKANGIEVKPWITGKEEGTGTVILSAYEGEEVDIQGGIKLTGINGLPVSLSAATESFDQPFTKEQALAVIDPFLV